MRDKVVIIRGFCNVSPQITIAPIERVNADNVVLIAALKYPQTLPETWARFQFDPTEVLCCAKEILEFWHNHDNEHLIAAEYANVVVDRMGKVIKAVEGDSLEVDWFYQTVRNYHRHFGQTVVDCIFKEDKNPRLPFKTKHLIIDGVEFTLEEGIDRLKSRDTLG